MDNIDYNNIDDITKLLFDIVYKKKQLNNEELKTKKPKYSFESKNNKNLLKMQNILKDRREVIPFFNNNN